MQPAKLLGPPPQQSRGKSNFEEFNGGKVHNYGDNVIISPRAERPPKSRGASVEPSTWTVRAGSVDRAAPKVRAGSVERAFKTVRASSVSRNEQEPPIDGIDLSDPSSFLSAAFKGELEKIRYFLSQASNMKMNVVDSLGNTALHLSAFSGHENVVKLLLQTKSVLNSPKVLQHRGAISSSSRMLALWYPTVAT